MHWVPGTKLRRIAHKVRPYCVYTLTPPMNCSRKTIADYESLKLYPRHRWKIKGTINNARNTPPDTYVTQFKEWLASVQKDVLKTKANVDLHWFLRVEKKERRWHLHFIMGDQNIGRETKTPGGVLAFCSKIAVRWPVKCNSQIEEYLPVMPKGGTWEEYLCKVTEEDPADTYARWSQSLKKAVKREQAKMEKRNDEAKEIEKFYEK